jgi:predicted site-specific integrase-resolvase
MTKRATVADVAQAVGNIISPYTLRNWVDSGVLPAERDFRGTRWFPDKELAAKQVKDLLYGRVVTDDAKKGQL